MADDHFYNRTARGVRLAVRLTPRSKSAACDGLVRDADGRARLQIRVTAPPADGEANAALIRFVAKELSVRPSAISIVSGCSSRLKMLEIEGDASDLEERLNSWIEAVAPVRP